MRWFRRYLTPKAGMILAYDALKRRYPAADITMYVSVRTHLVKDKPVLYVYCFEGSPSDVVVLIRDEVAVVLNGQLEVP